MSKKRYAQVGLGSRSGMYTKAIANKYSDTCQIVALCDVNQGRMDLTNRKLQQWDHPKAATYPAGQFEQMIAQAKPDTVIVTTVDATHHQYIIRAMQLGCDVVTEKPMTTDEAKCRRILQTVEDTGRSCQVTFNYRYAPHRSQVKEILDSGQIGQIYSIDFAWPLDTRHGADYFRRWHRKRENSGSLLVHKSTHHFDLVNWWLEDWPEEVFCHGSRQFYTPATAEAMGLTGHGPRCLDCPVKDKCKFSLDLSSNERLKEMYLDNEDEDGYFRDRCVFGDEIDIWDNMSVSVRYRKGTLLNYFLHTYSPWEGYQIAFNGSKGRLEHGSAQFSYVSGASEDAPGEMKKNGTYTTIMPHHADPEKDFINVKIRTAEGGHGGGDDPLLADIFDPDAPADPLHRKANQVDGAYSILTGVAAGLSIDRSSPINIDQLIAAAPLGKPWR
ncbi:MAG: Gfo/Idh/MocA family oxidoreductase [Phycisphaerae bacterium]